MPSNNDLVGVATKFAVLAIIISVIILFVVIGFFILVHVCILGRFVRRDNIAGGSSTGSGNVSSRTIMSEDDVERLPCFHYVAKEGLSSPAGCVVCLESLNIGDKCRLLPACQHSFHARCVDKWLLKTPFCPICRTHADSGKGDSEVEADSHLSHSAISSDQRSLSPRNTSS